MGLSKKILRHIFLLLMSNGLGLSMELIKISNGVHVQSTELRSLNTIKRIPLSKARDGLDNGAYLLPQVMTPVKAISYSGSPPAPLKTANVLTAYRQAKGNRLIVADYDGTLSKFFNTPDDAIPSPELTKALEVLTLDPRNTVWLVSGRNHGFLDKHFGFLENLGIASEYGATLVYPGGRKEIDSAPLPTGAGLEKIEEFMEASTKTIPGSTVEKKPYGRVWHYRVPYTEDKCDTLECQKIREECIQEAANLQLRLRTFIKRNNLPYEVAPGSLVVEVKPSGRDKGTTVRKIYQELPSHPDFILIAGDSSADEKMFKIGNKIESQAKKERRYASKVYTLKVTHQEEGETSARYTLDSPDEVVQLLRDLAKHTNNQI